MFSLCRKIIEKLSLNSNSGIQNLGSSSLNYKETWKHMFSSHDGVCPSVICVRLEEPVEISKVSFRFLHRDGRTFQKDNRLKTTNSIRQFGRSVWESPLWRHLLDSESRRRRFFGLLRQNVRLFGLNFKQSGKKKTLYCSVTGNTIPTAKHGGGSRILWGSAEGVTCQQQSLENHKQWSDCWILVNFVILSNTGYRLRQKGPTSLNISGLKRLLVCGYLQIQLSKETRQRMKLLYLLSRYTRYFRDTNDPGPFFSLDLSDPRWCPSSGSYHLKTPKDKYKDQ